MAYRLLFTLRYLVLVVVSCGALLVSEAAAQTHSQSIRVPTSALESDGKARLRFAPLQLQGGSHLTLVSPREWAPLADQLSHSLQRTHKFFSRIFGDIPAFRTTLRLMDDKSFYESTGAPAWTNAMYYRNQIIIPLPESGTVNLDNLFRSIRHEYTHAVTHALSNGKCPGWLDEGLAQWVEGSENPALQPALLVWLTTHRPVPLNMLQGGFTKLDADMVPAAYAQSLFAARHVVDNYGFSTVRKYLDELRSGEARSRAFSSAFAKSERQFERELGQKLNGWSREHRHAYN